MKDWKNNNSLKLDGEKEMVSITNVYAHSNLTANYDQNNLVPCRERFD